MSLKLIGGGEAVVPDKPQASTDESRPLGSKAVLNGRTVLWGGPGWGWQSEKSFQKLQGSGKLNRSIFSDPVGVIGNELRYIGGQIQEVNKQRPYAGRVGTMNIYRDASTGQIGRTSQSSSNISAAVTVGAAENAAKFLEAARQKASGRQANPEGGRVGNAIEAVSDLGYRLLGATPPAQQNEFEQSLDATARSAAVSVAGTAAAIKIVPAMGAGLAGAALTGGARWALGELLSTYLDDNRPGNLSNLVSSLTGTEIPLSVDVGNDDWIDAATKSLIPNALPGTIISALGGAGQLARNPGAIGAGMKNTRRWLASKRKVGEISSARTQLERAGVTQTDPATGATAWRQAEADFKRSIGIADEAAPEARQIPTVEGEITTENFGKAEAAPLPQVDDASVSPWDVRYDPDLPEADVVLDLMSQLDDKQLVELATGQGPVVPRLNEILEARAFEEPRPDLAQGNVMAPASNVADRIGADGQPRTYGELLETVDAAALRQVASPENNPELSRLISDTTGREWGEFTKADIVEGLVEYQQETGQNLLIRDWNQNFRPTPEIQADPQRFQFKENVNEAGEQIGNSLSGVDRWDTVAEGVIDVWTDPADGVTYVVNGHNRLARAKQLGIPTVPVRELPAATAAEARALGALANIKEGKGTVFDAAKFMRDSGISDVDQLQRMGAPLTDGNAAKGLALSKLPDNLFQDAVDGRLSQGKAIALGGSGLDETQMQAAAKALAAKDMSDATFNEVLQQVRSAPVMEGSQVDLFGNTESLSLMTQKAALVAKIRSDLISDKNLFGRAARGADRLQQGGNRIDVQGSTQVAADSQAVLAMFDQVKYAPGPVSDLLNDGAQQIAEGAKPGVIAGRIRGQVAEAVGRSIEEQGMPAPRVPAAPEPEVPAARTLEPAEREALRIEAIRKAVDEAEVRPPESPIPELPDGPAVPPRVARADAELRGELEPGTPAAQAMADEIRLATEYFEQDARLRMVAEEGARDAASYERLTFDQKKAEGLVDGYDARPMVAEPSEAAAAPVRPAPMQLVDGGAPSFSLPQELTRSAPRYGQASIRFGSDLDKAAYILANDAVRPSKAAPKFRAAVEAAGLDVSEVIAHGKKVKAAIKQAAGGGAAPKKSGTIELPAQRFDQGSQGPQARTKAADLETRKQIDANNKRMDEIRRKAQQEGC